MEIGWERLEDSSGLEGYCYSFSQDESNEPELVNLSPEARGIFLASSEEGVHYLHIRAKDRVGNYSKTLTIPLTVDLTPPPKPSIIPLPLSEDGYYEHNSPVFRWTTGAHDTMGYNYRLTREQEAIESSAIRTIEPIAPFTSIGYGQWHFNVAAIDRAGNVGETAHFSLRLQSLAEGGSERVDTASETPTYSMERRSASSGPLSRSALYFVIGGNLIIALFIISQVLFRRQAGTQQPRRGLRRGLPMWKMGFGLRTKFSLLIVALVLVLTVGISSIVNTVNTTNQRKTLADQMLDKALLMLENMTNIAREGILNDDELLLMSLIAKTMENEDVTFSAVLDPHGKVIAHSDIERIGTVQTGSNRSQPASARELLIEPAYDPDNLEEAYELAAPVIFSGEWIGSVWLGYSTESISRTMEAQRRTNFYGTLIITALTVLIGITGAVAMATLTIRPIQTLTESARTIGEGNLDHRIHIASRDELGVLSDEFNRMTARLVEYQRKIEKQAKFDEQLEIARRIQQDLIPRAGIRDESVIIDGFYRPARGIGGDYYDFFPVSENKIGIIMSDVAGKGVPAALMMIMIRTIFMSLVHSGIAEPARMVTLLNDTLSSSMAGDRFATLLFGVYDLEGPEFKYTNAGYGPLLVYRKTEDACTLIESSNGSFPVGIMPEADYSNERPISFKTGDVLYLFTDGITEARNEKNEEYGLTRLLEILPGFSKQAPGEIIQSVVADLSRFVGDTEQFDDMSIAILQVRDGIQPT
jgi:sigma-B regulation protein RsbU (phosphoserine phosphatase)